MIALIARVLGPALTARYRSLLALYVLTGICQGAAYVSLVPFVRAVFSDDPAASTPWLALLISLVVIVLGADYLSQTRSLRLGCDVGRHLHHRLGDHAVALPLGWFSGDRVGRLGRLVSSGVQDAMISLAYTQRRVATAAASGVSVLVGSFFVEWRAGVLLAAVTPVVYGMWQLTDRVGASADERIDAAGVEAADRVVEYARTQPVQRAFGRTEERFAALDDSFQAMRTSLRRVMRSAVPAVTAFGLTTQLCFIGAVLGGAALVLHDSLDLATLLGVAVLVLRFLEPLQLLGTLSLMLRMERGSYQRIADILDADPLPEPPESASTAVASGEIGAAGGPAIEFRHVDFGYQPGTPVLRDVSFSVPPRATVALVGPSGSGKSTVARLVARFYDVDAGSVRVGGIDVRDQTTVQLMARLAPVFQDVFLLAGTIEDNIRLARPDATPEQLRAAMAAARVDEIIDRLPAGPGTQVGEGGTSLSGGERQRVSLARALLKDAPIVVLDEPTSALDTENAAAISLALAELTRTRTVLIIAHQLQTIRNSDLILVLDRGRVVQSGRHEQLIATDGVYARFWRQRERSEHWSLT